ncbi:MAG: hypothetical protein OXH69_25130 [Acidobacteria bacterium]|nr:hypothetical protein [Acidobacteriota bacterium]
MIEALGAEISASKGKKDGKFKVGLLNGRRVEGRGPYGLYRFEVDVELPSLQDNTRVEVEVPSHDPPPCRVSCP